MDNNSGTTEANDIKRAVIFTVLLDYKNTGQVQDEHKYILHDKNVGSHSDGKVFPH